MRFTDPAEGSRLLVLDHNDAALMQKRCSLCVQGRGQRSGQTIERVALHIDRHKRLGVLRQLRKESCHLVVIRVFPDPVPARPSCIPDPDERTYDAPYLGRATSVSSSIRT